MQDTSSGAASSTAPAEGGPAGGNDAGEDGGHSDHASPCTPPDEVAREGTEKLGTKFPPSPFLDVQKLQRRRGWTINILLFDFTFPFKRFSTTSAEKRVEQKDIPFRLGRGGSWRWGAAGCAASVLGTQSQAFLPLVPRLSPTRLPCSSWRPTRWIRSALSPCGLGTWHDRLLDCSSGAV